MTPTQLIKSNRGSVKGELGGRNTGRHSRQSVTVRTIDVTSNTTTVHVTVRNKDLDRVLAKYRGLFFVKKAERAAGNIIHVRTDKSCPDTADRLLEVALTA